ncbi:uncharacterized protein LOC119770534 [Culex quinquefasciatus]|uniref:uncharacterized protein LOC119770534 n=1 Tax=Culex quinquefasciatus TaxID=7176 RepID=UPI0018E327BC|nr:uncharacterized protein LOC119770534 [Culex quinquefasciatus]
MPSFKCIVCKISLTSVKRRNVAISFHNFPSDPERKQAWIEFCGTDTGVVCSEHFSDDCFLGGRDEKPKRRRLVTRAVPTIRFSVMENGTRILPTTNSEDHDPDDFSESFDYMPEEDAISLQHDTISELSNQVEEYKNQLEDSTKKLHEMEVALFERDCIIEELRKKLNEATKN